MEKLFLAEILAKVSGTALLKKSAALKLSHISTDTRSLKPGDVYLALKGENFDGNDFLTEAIDKGATGIISSRPPAKNDLRKLSFAVVVADTLSALQQIAALHRQKFTLPVVAITGSNGKTTTKEMTGIIIGSKYKTLVTAGNFNNQIGLPLTILKLNKKHQAAVLEFGTSKIGEIATLTKIAQPKIGVITCVGHTHLAELKSLANVLKAKMELIDNLPEDGIAILNSDDPYLRKILTKVRTSLVTYGLKSPATVSATNIRSLVTKNQLKFELKYKGRTEEVTLSAIGEHNVYNALAASAVGLTLGLSLKEVTAGLERFKPVAGRMRLLRRHGIVIIDDCYNANPDSLKAALLTLDNFHSNGRKIAVLGDMLELGEESAEIHREIGGLLGGLSIDILYVVGGQAKILAQAAGRAGFPRENIKLFNPDQGSLLVEQLKKIWRKEDVILVKASHGLHLEKVVAGIIS